MARDVWYKVKSLSGASTAVAAAVIAFLGSYLIHNQQETANRMHLYTQLMSEQEKSENQIRRDMFTTILTSFIGKRYSNQKYIIAGDELKTTSIDDGDEIDLQLLKLNLMSRNFHESMDLEPLFRHVLLNIVHKIPKKCDFTDGELVEESGLAPLKQKVVNRLLRKTDYRNVDAEHKKELITQSYLNLRKRKLNELVEIAHRITAKQLESLSAVHTRIRFTIYLNKTNQDYKPNVAISDLPWCEKEGCKKGPIYLKLDNVDGNGLTCMRSFTIQCCRSYPDWNQVLIKVTTNKLPSEIAADPEGGDKKTSEFWLGYFDFPLIDNTFLSENERYAVILDSIDDNEANASLLYFPASYAGFKEKSYYQHRIMNLLLKERFQEVHSTGGAYRTQPQ